MQEGVFFSTLSTIFIICRFFDNGYSDQCEEMPCHNFDFHFSTNQQYWAYFQVLLGHLYFWTDVQNVHGHPCAHGSPCDNGHLFSQKPKYIKVTYCSLIACSQSMVSAMCKWGGKWLTTCMFHRLPSFCPSSLPHCTKYENILIKNFKMATAEY